MSLSSKETLYFISPKAIGRYDGGEPMADKQNKAFKGARISNGPHFDGRSVLRRVLKRGRDE